MMKTIYLTDYDKYLPALERQGLGGIAHDYRLSRRVKEVLKGVVPLEVNKAILGYVLEELDPEGGDTLMRTLSAASDALDFAKKRQFKSWNHLKRDNPTYLPDREEFNRLVYLHNNQIHAVNREFEALPVKNLFEKSRLRAKHILQANIGNCHEIADCLFFYLCERLDPEFQIDAIAIGNGNHIFLLINRAKNGVIARPASWGRNAVILDGWKPAFFLASMYQSRLKAYEASDELGIPRFLDFNVRSHSFIPLQARHLSVGEFQFTAKLGVSDLKNLLRDFHEAKTQDQKVEAAHQITKSVSPELLEDETVRLLYSQMHYFCEIAEGHYFYSAEEEKAEKRTQICLTLMPVISLLLLYFLLRGGGK